jgi:hypothetical protein
LLAAVAGGTLLTLAASVPLARGDARNPTISPSEIKPGMKGYGLTVFRGTVPERFDVEVIGVLQSFLPGQPLILIKTPNPRLDVVNTVRGMSGSPIYIEGRLAGAYSYSLAQFEMEPVAGVTPIDLMLTEMRRPIPPGFWQLEGRSALLASTRTALSNEPPGTSTRFEGSPGHYDLEEHARQLAGRFSLPSSTNGLAPVGTPLMLAGFSSRAVESLRTLLAPLGLEPLQGGGGTTNDPSAPAHFVNGGGLGVQLARGDVSSMGLGTATYVDGSGKLAGFGHPMLNGGAEALPTCVGSILWIIASAAASHKIGECARPLGTLVQDRQSAIVVDEHVIPSVIPVDIDIAGVVGASRTHWHFEVTDDRFLGPGLALRALESVIEATTSEQRRDLTWKLHSEVTVARHGRIDVDDVGTGTPDGQDLSHGKIGLTLGDVLNNPWEHARIDKVQARLEVTYGLEIWRLRGVELMDPIVDAGQRARLRLHLMPKFGPEVTRVVEVTLPEELAGKDVELDVVPGYEVVPELAPPESLDELLANEPRQNMAPRAVVVQFRVPSQGIAYRGHVTPRLPAFTLDALRPTSDSAGPEPFPSFARTVVPIDFFVEGRDKVKVKVRSVLR